MSTSERISAVFRRQGAALPTSQGFLNRRTLAVAVVAVVAVGLAMNWDWLSAVGTAPILISVLPCAAMCALGLCMRGGTGASCSTTTKANGESPSGAPRP